MKMRAAVNSATLAANAPKQDLHMSFGQRGLAPASAMIIATTENLAGYRVERTLGQVFGVVVRSRGLGGNLMAGLRAIVGGEIKEYSQMIEQARRHAIDRMSTNATYMGANAVLMMRFDSSEIGQTMSEVVAYGTAAYVVELTDAARPGS